MKAQSGFTLVEALTGGIISTLLAGTILSMVNMVGFNLRESAAHARLERMQAVAAEQIRRSTRKAYGPKLSISELGDIQNISKTDNSSYAGLTEVWLMADDPSVWWAYKISGNYLMELRNGNWENMTIGQDTVKIDSVTSSFAVLANRRGIVADLRYRIQENDTAYAYPILPDSILCRGNP